MNTRFPRSYVSLNALWLLTMTWALVHEMLTPGFWWHWITGGLMGALITLFSLWIDSPHER